ncbi:MAG: TIGR04211 family SH3 domain-containing protein [Thioalkalispiraceae bacterium]|jgi:uncharacterized protein YgiM (DUF1202 family)
MPRSIFLLLITSLAALSVSQNLFAKEVFVKDSLRVGVRTEPDNSLSPIAVVTTGMKLEVLDNAGQYVKIEAPSGVVGWIKSTYVSEEAPAVIQLEKLREKYKQLDQELVKQQRLAQATALNNKNLSTELEQLKQANAELHIQLQEEIKEDRVSRLSYLWKILLIVLVGVAGFAGGVAWYRKKMMRRLGGLHF